MIDALIAEQIMGWKLFDSPSGEGKYWYNADGTGLPRHSESFWNPQSNIAQAINILRDKFIYPEWQWSIINIWGWQYVVRIAHNSVEVAVVENVSLPLAICCACLKAKGILYEEVTGAAFGGTVGE